MKQSNHRAPKGQSFSSSPLRPALPDSNLQKTETRNLARYFAAACGTFNEGWRHIMGRGWHISKTTGAPKLPAKEKSSRAQIAKTLNGLNTEIFWLSRGLSQSPQKVISSRRQAIAGESCDLRKVFRKFPPFDVQFSVQRITL